MPPEIVEEAPKPEMSDYEKADFATEVAFGSLLNEARKLGLHEAPVMGFMELPEQALTQQFKEVCRSILQSLGAGGLNP